jgi:hypothetical protein
MGKQYAGEKGGQSATGLGDELGGKEPGIGFICADRTTPDGMMAMTFGLNGRLGRLNAA